MRKNMAPKKKHKKNSKVISKKALNNRRKKSNDLMPIFTKVISAILAKPFLNGSIPIKTFSLFLLARFSKFSPMPCPISITIFFLSKIFFLIINFFKNLLINKIFELESFLDFTLPKKNLFFTVYVNYSFFAQFPQTTLIS